MVPLAPVLKKACFSLLFIAAAWLAILLCLLHPALQRNALYAHRIGTAGWHDLNQPEQWGFLRNQVQPFRIGTPDGESLYAWHISPLGVYTKSKEKFLRGSGGLAEDVTTTAAFETLTQPGEPEPWLVINFHGNAGHVAQGWRTDTYRALAAGAPERIHVLAFDYRGFGHSSGSPTEEGLIADGIAVVQWAIEVAKVPPERIVLVGQSLGTAVSTAVAEHFSLRRATEFAGLVLVAAFSDLPKLLTTYAIGGVFPLLSPLKSYPRLQGFFSDRAVDRWPTATRLAKFVSASQRPNLVILHARDDHEIVYSHADLLFYAAANAISAQGLSQQQIDRVKHHEDFGPAGWTNTWTSESSSGGLKTIKQVIRRHGGHNRIMTHAPVAEAVLSCFEASGDTGH